MPMGQMQKTIKLNVGTSEDLWPYQVVDVIQQVMEEGLKKYPKGEGWGKYVHEHIQRAYNHLETIVGGYEPGNEDHLAHAFTRLMMAVAIERGYTLGDDEFAERDREVEKRMRKGSIDA